MLSVLPRFGNVAWVYCDRLSCGGLKQMFAELDVEVNPWEWFGKVLPKGLFAVVSIDLGIQVCVCKSVLISRRVIFFEIR